MLHTGICTGLIHFWILFPVHVHPPFRPGGYRTVREQAGSNEC
jgi:hypothetical protein